MYLKKKRNPNQVLTILSPVELNGEILLLAQNSPVMLRI